MIDNVSHEFRTPLTVIKEYASLLQEGLLGNLNGEQSEFIGIIADRADDLSNMVNDLVDSTRVEAGQVTVDRQVTTLTEIIANAEDTLRQKTAVRNIDLAFDVDSALAPVYCDPHKATRVLFNLVVNGIKYTAEDGWIRIWARRDASARCVEVGVSNSGRGFREEDAKAIAARLENVTLRPEQRTKGFGLGLNIANELVDAFLGTMRLASIADEGSTFSFTIPFATLESLGHCFLARVQRLYGPDFQISRVIAGTESELTDEEMAVLDAHVTAAAESSDLVWSVSRGSWLILSTDRQREAAELERRLRHVIEGTNRERKSPPLPVPVIRLADTVAASALDVQSIVGPATGPLTDVDESCQATQTLRHFTAT